MPDKKTEVPEISSSSTKKEMLDAYNKLLVQLEEKRELELNPSAKLEEKRTKETIKTADSITTETVVKKISELKLEFGTALSELLEKLEETVAQYKSVKEAVAVKQKELQEIFEIQKEAATLAALIEAQKLLKENSEKEILAKKEKLELEIKTTREEWEKAKKQHEADLKESGDAEQKQRKRDKEEFDYNFQREKQLVKNAFEAEKSAWERDWNKTKEDKEKELSEREKSLKASETELSELRKKVEKFPQELNSSIEKAVKDATERIILEAKHKEQLTQNKFDGEKLVLTTKIESLENTIKEQNQQVAKLSAQLEKSYGQVQDIAVKAVEGSAGKVNIAAVGEMMKDQARKTEPTNRM
jgi:hypothetical protein